VCPPHSTQHTTHNHTHDEMPNATGKKIGKRAAASNWKNRDAADCYIDAVEKLAHSDLDSLFRVNSLARVVRPKGANRLVVTLQNGEEGDILIAGRLRFHGRAASKTDRPNCMVLNSIVLVDGGYAVSNLSKAHIARIKSAYAAAGISTYKGFFDGSVGADCEGFDWDNSEAIAHLEATRVSSDKEKEKHAPDDSNSIDDAIDVDGI